MLNIFSFFKHNNLTYFITFIAVATFVDHKYVTSHTKLYKMCYIGGFIRKTIKGNINQKSP